MPVSNLFIGILASLLIVAPIINKPIDKNKEYEENTNQQSEGSFTVLSYNIAGLWEIISESHPKKYVKK